MNETYRKTVGLVIMLFVVGAIVTLEMRKPERIKPTEGAFQNINIELNTMPKEEKAKIYESAKEISSPDGFINTDFDGDGVEDGINIAELIGNKVILVDFWTYSCINCQRTLPYLVSWHKKYADEGLIIIGLHTPEFEFEKDYANVSRAVEKWGVTYPVVLDNDYSTWNAYRNRYWPRKYLIDVDGFIIYDHIGEGGYAETEARIVSALNELKVRTGGNTISKKEGLPENVDIVKAGGVKTPEIYLGSSRIQYLSNLPQQSCLSSSCEFNHDASLTLRLNTYSLKGSWNTSPEETTLESIGGSIFVQFSANKVNLVAGAKNVTSAEIYIDGKLVGAMSAGSDVKDGKVLFEEHDLYNLIDFKGQYGEHMLEIRFLEGGVSAFAFTFG